MLLGENRRRAEDERLLPVDRHGEGCAHSDLGLAEADVAADEPIHRVRRLEILLDSLDRARLILGLAVREGRSRAAQPVVGEIERDARRTLPLGVEREQLAGELTHGLPCSRLEVRPRFASQLGELRRLRVGADVLRELAELLVREIEAVVATEGDEEVVARDACDLLRLEAEELPDAVILVDDVVACSQVGERGERPAETGIGPRRTLPEDLAVGQQHEAELAPDEAAARRGDGEAESGVLRQRLAGLERLRLDLAKQRLLAQRLAAVRERDDDAVPGANEALQLGLGLGEPAGGDRGALRLERERLAARERVELGRAREIERGEAFLLPDATHVVRLPDEIGRRGRPAATRSSGTCGSEPRARPRRRRKRRLDEVGTALRGRVDDARSTGCSARCVNGENARTCSISSPKSSTRSGSRPVDGKTSTMPPRTAN